MGRISAEDMRSVCQEFGVNLRAQLEWHLSYNHYPSVPTCMVEPCIQAIEAIRLQDPALIIQLPEGVLWEGNDWAPACEIVEAHHLETWCPL